MKQIRTALLPGILVAGAILLLLPLLLRTERARSVLSSQVSGGCKAWNVVSSPNVKSSDSSLGAVSADSATDVWAVGTYLTPGSITQTLTDHWDGKHWSVVHSANVGSQSNGFFGVSAFSARDAWAVGYYFDNNAIPRTLIEQWNGLQWSVVPSPSPGSSQNFLSGVVTLSSNDAWAVGYFKNADGPFQTLIERWNGSHWSVVPSPNPGAAEDMLSSVAAASPTSIWAVGDYFTAGSPGKTLIEQWNGSHWSVVAGANPASSYSSLFAVASVSSSMAWAVGELQNGPSARRTLIERWDGTRWVVVPSPNANASDNKLFGVAAVSANLAWTVGYYINSKGNAQTLIEQWNGSHWSLVDSPSPGTGDNKLGGVTAVPSSNTTWTAGVYDNGGPAKSLVESHC